MTNRPFWILPVLIFSQFAGTSLWFAGNAIISDLQVNWNLHPASIGWVTSSVQFGFITGTLCFAFFTISDVFSPRKVFFVCSILGALANINIYLLADGLTSLLIFRFLTGFFLAGIYPVGMKIASGWYKDGLGRAMGFLVGALVLGTAFPHLIKGLGGALHWNSVIISVSCLCVLGGLLMFLLVPDGPYLYKGTKFNYKAIYHIFSSKDLRASAFGYFGHMWEIYTIWAFIPVLLAAYSALHGTEINIPVWAFVFIACGALGCFLGGIISRKKGSATVAFYQLAISALCCAFSPLLFDAPEIIFFLVLIIWGITVAGDSPQFSTLTAETAPKEYVGSALTIVTCIGFSITIFSIEFVNYVLTILDPRYVFILLTPGPIAGLFYFLPLYKKRLS
ncbi:MAG: MFS transporter [Candidatus Dadabacteria bacterium]|nr:MFS transporter [Candidatus Dadabacteria bacterium]NIS09125.1 MFS transporter [Candidatus Dadabacteria bacterium]NIV41558.1 MFS transporter [Candidatus Dadabacteria bacterium]NIX15702.1 MFS transporter [Candidatus Dadabacteria bacterium]NIY22433.1 MFS transporter [Candidatus Dadabacteria bacterium]